MKDTEIVELYWQRSERAVEESDRKYGAYCRTVAYNILESGEDAEECVNDTWLGAWNAMPDKRPSRLGAFLAKITRNGAISRALERSRLKRGGGQIPLALDELAECVPGGCEPEKALERRELERTLRRFVGSLPETERRVFLARYWYLAPVQEIADKLGFTRSKTAGMLHRTRKKLQRLLQEEGLCE